jgi:hypothetical protein
MAAPGGAEAQGARLLAARGIGVGADELGGLAAARGGRMDVADRRLGRRRRRGQQQERARCDLGSGDLGLAPGLKTRRAQVSSS